MRGLYIILSLLSSLTVVNALIELMLVYGYDSTNLGRLRHATEKIDWEIDPKPKIINTQAEDTRYACQTRTFIRPTFDESKKCERFEARLCDAWVKSWKALPGLREAKANFGWVSPFSLDRSYTGTRRKVMAFSTPNTHDYTIEFFNDTHCEDRMLDPDGRAIALTVDNVWKLENRIQVGEYLQKSEIPIQGYFRATKMKKKGIVDSKHHLSEEPLDGKHDK